MRKISSEKGSMAVFVTISFIFCMTILMRVYWSSTNYQITALQAEQTIKKIYGRDVNNINTIYNELVAADTDTDVDTEE